MNACIRYNVLGSVWSALCMFTDTNTHVIDIRPVRPSFNGKWIPSEIILWNFPYSCQTYICFHCMWGAKFICSFESNQTHTKNEIVLHHFWSIGLCHYMHRSYSFLSKVSHFCFNLKYWPYSCPILLQKKQIMDNHIDLSTQYLWDKSINFFWLLKSCLCAKRNSLVLLF